MEPFKIKISCPEHSEFVENKLVSDGLHLGAYKAASKLDNRYIYVGNICYWRFSKDEKPMFDNIHSQDYTNHPDWCWPRPENSKLTLEVGKKYITRGGNVVSCIGNSSVDSSRPICESSIGICDIYYSDGYISKLEDTQKDIVSEYYGPETLAEALYTVYNDSFSENSEQWLDGFNEAMTIVNEWEEK